MVCVTVCEIGFGNFGLRPIQNAAAVARFSWRELITRSLLENSHMNAAARSYILPYALSLAMNSECGISKAPANALHVRTYRMAMTHLRPATFSSGFRV